ncbi:rRNA maturation RNase YbeY [Winogradskyella sp. DF17]|uniref:Endoribonuclease YbeY n=1 Tax=Winogradskyella pelagia TaxID=2819984 RepID=A0ABS3SYF7_9FLAO|nr:rRNA maturation RNase YbeY [Winogradskyella sp. DF17]MBO3115249.1 rRNA maturation RNase YbeY [Winogradskyella sp. DF17]
MISFNYEMEFHLVDEAEWSNWLNDVILNENREKGELSYVFCTDEYLHKINIEYLNHDTYTDIITFDYSVGKKLHGDIYISVERVTENAGTYRCSVKEEMARVMVHGLLHLCGYKDKSTVEATIMRGKEDFYLSRFASLGS